MKTNLKFKVLRNIGKVYEESGDSKLTKTLFKKIDPTLQSLSEYFKVSKIQAFLIAHIFAMNYERNGVDISDLVRYFDCNAMKILEYNDDLNDLLSKDLIVRKYSRGHSIMDVSTFQYYINEKIGEAIIKNLPLPNIKSKSFESFIEILEELYNLGEQRDDEEMSTEELFRQTSSILKTNNEIPFVKKLEQMDLKIREKYVLLYLIWKTITGDESIDISRTLDVIFDRPAQKVKYMQNIMSENNTLIKRDLIKIEKAQFFNDTEMKLSASSLNLLEEEGIKIFANKKKKDNVIEPDKIKLKQLFYNEEENKQITLLQEMLSESKLKEIRERLTKKNLPKGVTTLLYGLPGTGKTETVYQIAKNTNREIVKVDISQSKSMWFGESEKKIKRIFTDYKDYAKQCDLTPILLFNEADAIISKRKEANSSNVSQTENTIQNIILEELENFEGIFFATTNLASNLDSAFERRFLFKIEFHKPNICVKTKIWKSKLPKLTVSNCKKLASKFNFSGGQIDNIAKKSEMHEIINGTNSTIDTIIEFCETEELSKSSKINIGFSIN